jgi:hypothetical protein
MAYTMYVNRAQNQATVHRTDCPMYETRLNEKPPLRYWAQTTYPDASAAKISAQPTGTQRISTCPLCAKQ